MIRLLSRPRRDGMRARATSMWRTGSSVDLVLFVKERTHLASPEYI